MPEPTVSDPREITAAEYQAIAPKPHKYKAQRTEVDGVVFASKAEARRYGELKLLYDQGEIQRLTLQPRFPLEVNGVKIGTYVADFAYVHPEAGYIVEDVKGVKTPVYKVKRKLVRALHGIEIYEVK